MSRRRPYTKVAKTNQIRAAHVKGKGDISFRGFQCMNPSCTEYIFAPEPIPEGFQMACSVCGFVHEDGGATKFYNYELQEIDPETKKPVRTIDVGEFSVLHSEYIAEASSYKYCIICNTLKPVSNFDAHGARKTGRQGECNLCKGIYNGIKNQTRLGDQHREAAQKRRLYIEISGEAGRIDSKEIFRQYEGKCFRCGKTLLDGDGKPIQGAFHIDHTLPALYLWAVTTQTATLLCSAHNNEKKGKWPSEYYNGKELRRLAVLTGLDYDILSGRPRISPEALKQLTNPKRVDELLSKYAKYRSDLISLRNRVLKVAGVDIFKVSGRVAKSWLDEAQARLKKD